MKAIDRAIDACGGLTEFSKRIETSPQTVSNWRMRDRVPAEHCPLIERATSGAVRCEDLRPDVDWAYLRGTGRKVKVAV